METTETIIEPTFRINRKVNFKGEKALEYTIRANNIKELRELEAELLEYLKEE